MVLEADVSLARVSLVGDIELMGRPIGPAVGSLPLVQIPSRDLLAVERHGDDRAIARDLQMVPLAHGLHRIASRLHQIVDRACVVETGRGCIIDGDLDSVEAHILAGRGSSGKVRTKTPLLQPLVILKSRVSVKSAQTRSWIIMYPPDP